MVDGAASAWALAFHGWPLNRRGLFRARSVWCRRGRRRRRAGRPDSSQPV